MIDQMKDRFSSRDCGGHEGHALPSAQHSGGTELACLDKASCQAWRPSKFASLSLLVHQL